MLRVLAVAGFVAGLGGCCGRQEPDSGADAGSRGPCASAPIPLAEVPNLPAEHSSPDFWLGLLAAAERDRVLLDEAGIAALNKHNAQQRGAHRDVFALPVEAPAEVAAQIVERFDWLGERLESGKLQEASAGTYGAARTLALAAAPADELRAARTEGVLQCVPMEAPLHEADPDERFDHNRCSGLHPGELLRILRAGDDGWLYAHVGHAVGWVRATSLTPALDEGAARRLRDGQPRLVVLRDGVVPASGPRLGLRLGTSFPLLAADAPGADATKPLKVWLPGREGLRPAEVEPGPAVRVDPHPLTRRGVFTVALAQLGRPYGWGGRRGGRDCSRLLLDLFATFGVRLGRHSGAQARSGSVTLELADLSERGKRDALRAAAARGLVLLYMPGHIMLYLGSVGDRDFALSSVAELRRPCGPPGGFERLLLDRVVVTDLEPGRGTPRRAFIERLTRAAVFGS